MKDQLVSFNVAVLAKEKGFNITQFLYYTPSGNLKETTAWIEDEDDIERPITLSTILMFTDARHISAPTQSLLQKWLRERHGIQTEISMGVKYINDKLTNLYSYSIFSCSPQLKINWKFSYKKPITYEEALEAGLLEALKQIK